MLPQEVYRRVLDHDWRLTTEFSDRELTCQHAGAPRVHRARGSAARGRALYAERGSLQRFVRRH
jgi:hypothetical protein